ncbi:MAG: sugar phosphate isomerase/epimerase family protein [Anaerolineae bacterium]
MAIKGIGINAHASRIDGSLEVLEQDLAYFQRVGFDYVEIPVHGVDAILNGRLNLRQVKRIKEILSKFHLQYATHCFNWLNLMDAEEFSLHKSIFEASIDFASEIGAEILVYHSGRVELGNQYLGQAALTRELLSLPDRAIVNERKRVEQETLAELADLAERKGVTICVENADPRVDEEALWELARRVRVTGIDLFYRIAPAGDIALYNYGGVIERLVDQVEKVGKENVGITFDFGHAYIASNYYGFDFLDSIELAKPLIKHVHVHDDFGKPAGLDRREILLIPQGKGDLHMPIGWGQIPYREVFSRLKGYEGIVLLELKPRYSPYFEEALQETRRLLAESGI